MHFVQSEYPQKLFIVVQLQPFLQCAQLFESEMEIFYSNPLNGVVGNQIYSTGIHIRQMNKVLYLFVMGMFGVQRLCCGEKSISNSFANLRGRAVS